MSLREEVETAINRNSAENGSNTPDFILAEFLTDCLAAFDKATVARDKWRNALPGWPPCFMVGPQVGVPDSPNAEGHGRRGSDVP